MFSFRLPLNKVIVAGPNLLFQQTRNTFILKRKWPPPLHKKNGKPSKLRARHFVYDLVEDTNVTKQPDVKVILSQFVDGVGDAGDVLTLRPTIAYRDFLMPGLAMYASPENLAKHKVDENKPKTESEYSSPYVQRTLGCLSRLVLQITMSKTQPWILEPWHVRVSFRKAGFVVPEHAITMPPVTIKGPDLSLQEKEFAVTVKVNNKEEVNVRCRIHHWATGLERLPWVPYHWKEPKEALVPEQAPVLESLPLLK
ncbi:large ribosomal subunit protein bL9m [Maniola hyperantus]|uniref:large ribosomal subunit protein bL9m n=1 Tax=Aphantopus hyperantus TaxID=2795564 RepID=UPI00156A5D74|nr:39S ribosomal protein L9, mitochondrial [Maniola hyperantus]XP_034834319.1 39S ribosomal protein L9, mitochondrial [Maniola hyperantus]